MKIKKFFEMFEDKYDYGRIIKILHKTYGWGKLGILDKIDEFEQNPDYFSNPNNEDDYIEQFHIFLSDLKVGKLRGKLDSRPLLRLGKWKTGYQVDNPVSIYNRMY